LAPDAVVVANAGGASFLRVGYDGVLRERVWANALEALAPIERFGLVDDTWAEAVAGGVPAAEYLGLVRGLPAETDLHVWQTVMTTIGWFDRFLEAEPREGLRRYVRELARPAFDRLGWEPGPYEADLSRSLRGTLVSALAILGGDADVSARAREIEEEARAGETVDASLAAAAVAVVAATGDGDDFERFLARSKDAPTPQEQLRYLYGLADFRQPGIMDRALELALSDEVRSQNAPFLLTRAMANRDVGDRAWRFVKGHWEEVNRRLPPNTIIYLADGVRFLTTPEQEADARAFFDEHDIPQARKMLKQVLERQRINVAFRRRVEPQLASFFG
jgi:puromycin-sensitive aminopeptidase